MNTQSSRAESATPKLAPLAVDLDGTLIRGDLLWQGFFALLGSDLLGALRCLCVLAVRGKAAFKQAVAERASIDAACLPYRQCVVEAIKQASRDGRSVLLATAANEQHANAVARHLGLFEEVLASDRGVNLSGERKLDALRDCCPSGFDYIGDSRADLPVWSGARAGFAVAPSSGVRRKAHALGLTLHEIPDSDAVPGDWRVLVKLWRPHQWLKNVLIAVPLLTSGKWINGDGVLACLLAIVAFSLVASATYAINDLTDIESDRRHPRKKHRPLAAGAIGMPTAFVASATMLVCTVGVTALVAPAVSFCLIGYVIVTLLYSFVLKEKAVVDVLVLALLYTYRIVLGGVATDTAISHWLLSFSSFLFLSLALAKRYTEIDVATEQTALNSRRGYRYADKPVILSAGVGAALISILVFSLYIDGETSSELYPYAKALWLATPALLYWEMRVWLLAGRGELNDDPIVFAARDRHTYVVVAVVAAAFALASLGDRPSASF